MEKQRKFTLEGAINERLTGEIQKDTLDFIKWMKEYGFNSCQGFWK